MIILDRAKLNKGCVYMSYKNRINNVKVYIWWNILTYIVHMGT